MLRRIALKKVKRLADKKRERGEKCDKCVPACEAKRWRSNELLTCSYVRMCVGGMEVRKCRGNECAEVMKLNLQAESAFVY